MNRLLPAHLEHTDTSEIGKLITEKLEYELPTRDLLITRIILSNYC